MAGSKGSNNVIRKLFLSLSLLFSLLIPFYGRLLFMLWHDSCHSAKLLHLRRNNSSRKNILLTLRVKQNPKIGSGWT